jgi:hypothetical protein
MTLKDLETSVGNLAQTSKMPCPSWSISAKRCNVGSKLAAIKGSICEGCYALKGAYAWGNTQAALERRWEAYNTSPAYFVANMTELLKRKGLTHFRWFDSGDLQSLEMLEAIVQIAENVPECSFWLPTKEIAIVRRWLEKTKQPFPPNLCVRLSAYKRDHMPPYSLTIGHLPVSTVTDKQAPIGFACPSRDQGNKCLNCRACWQISVPVVSYFWH